jgi:polyhydroxyalkanoate synthesis regulator phasin
MCNIRLDGFKGDGLERIIGNLDKAKLKLDEAFFYLDEIEELIQEEELSEAAGPKVSQAAERLTTELSALSGRVAELEDILRALEERQDSAGQPGE